MRLKSEDEAWARNQTKSRLRPRSTIFDDGVDKSDRRQQRRQNEKKIIDEEFDLELEENEELDELGWAQYLSEQDYTIENEED